MRGRPRLQDPDENTSMPPEGYEGRWHTPAELRRVNKELAKVGRRICRTHQSHALPLTPRYFWRVRKNSFRFSTECKKCAAERSARTKRERMQRDPEYHQRVLEQARESNYRNWKKRSEQKKEYHARRKRERLAAVLEERAS